MVNNDIWLSGFLGGWVLAELNLFDRYCVFLTHHGMAVFSVIPTCYFFFFTSTCTFSKQDLSCLVLSCLVLSCVDVM